MCFCKPEIPHPNSECLKRRQTTVLFEVELKFANANTYHRGDKRRLGRLAMHLNFKLQ
jgi:hypothetical protein